MLAERNLKFRMLYFDKLSLLRTDRAGNDLFACSGFFFDLSKVVNLHVIVSLP